MAQKAFDAFYVEKFAVRILPLNLAAYGLTHLLLLTWGLVSSDDPDMKRFGFMGASGAVLVLMAGLCHALAVRQRVLAAASTAILFAFIASLLGSLTGYWNERGAVSFMSTAMLIMFVSALVAPRYWMLLLAYVATLGPMYAIALYDEPRIPQQSYQMIRFAIGVFTTSSLFYFLVNKVKWSYFRLVEELEERSRRDSLTGMLNRTAWFDQVEERIASQSPSLKNAAVLYMDVDYFKAVNDELGHAAGDRLLQAVAESVGESLDSDALVARFGGEEFVAFLPGSDVERAQEIVARVQAALRGAEGHLPGVTMSYGVTEWKDGEDLDATVKRADRALLAAKRNGRNRVEVADLPGSPPTGFLEDGTCPRDAQPEFEDSARLRSVGGIVS